MVYRFACQSPIFPVIATQALCTPPLNASGRTFCSPEVPAHGRTLNARANPDGGTGTPPCGPHCGAGAGSAKPAGGGTVAAGGRPGARPGPWTTAVGAGTDLGMA